MVYFYLVPVFTNTIGGYMKRFLLIISCILISIPVFSFQSKNKEWISFSRVELEKNLNNETDPKNQVDLMNLLAYKLSSYDHKKAEKFAKDAKRIADQKNYKEGIVESINNLGLVFIRMGEIKTAKEKFDEAEKKAEKTSYEIGRAQAVIGLIRYYQLRGQFDIALTNGMKWKFILEDLKYEHPLRDRVLANLYHGLGVIYFYDQHQYEESEKYLKKSFDLRYKCGDQDAIGIAYYSLGEVNQYMGYYKVAYDYFIMSKIIGEKNANKYILANVNQGLGDVFLKWRYNPQIIGETKWVYQANINAAKIKYDVSEALFNEIGDKFQKAAIYLSLGDYYLQKNNLAEAKKKLKLAYGLSSEMENANTIKLAARQLALLYKRKGNKKKEKYYKEMETKKDKYLRKNSSFWKTTTEVIYAKRNKIQQLQLLLIILAVSGIIIFLLSRANSKKIHLLGEVGKKITSCLRKEEILTKVYANINKIIDASSFGIGIYNSKFEQLEFMSIEYEELLSEFMFSLKETNRMAIQCFINQQEIVTRDYTKEFTNYSDKKPTPKIGRSFTSHIYLPLIFNSNDGQEKRIGVITVQSPYYNAYSRSDLNLFRNIANYTAIALENARSYEKVKKLSKLKDEFIYTLSHQSKTPLTTIALSNQYLKQYLPELTQVEIMEEIEASARNVTRIRILLEDLMQFGRQFNPKQCNIENLIQMLIQEFKADEGMNHKVIFYSCCQNSTAFIDEELVKILIKNLLTNSVKYSIKGSEIEVMLDLNVESIILKIKDQGTGIPDEIIQLNDKRFHRGSNASDIGGTGLGLSIVEQFVKLHKGTIEYQRNKDIGTTVTITLPNIQR